MSPVTPRPAGTVVFVRDTPAGVEAYCQQRPSTMAFAAGALVFPGGAVDPCDADPGLPWRGRGARWWAENLGCSPDEAMAFVSAALREACEESGVLLAEPAHDVSSAAPFVTAHGDCCAHCFEVLTVDVPTKATEPGVGAEPDGDSCTCPGSAGATVSAEIAASVQTALLGGAGWFETLTLHDLVLRDDLLWPWARWVTPEDRPRRFDTCFFTAHLPAGQTAAQHPDVTETTHTGWFRAADVLARSEAGEVYLMPPTRAMLAACAQAPGTNHLLSDVRPMHPMIGPGGSP